MTSPRNWILFSALRIGLFAVVLAVLLFLQIEPWIAAVIAAVIGLCVSYIFFRPQRVALAESVSSYRTAEHRDEDSDVENAAIDEVLVETTSGSQDRPADPAASEGEGRREGDAEDEGGEARQLEREDELGGRAPGQGDHHGR